ncbi:MAG: hypothetical protein ACI9C1_001902 [Candidatus Aldehydirespiratoraceae bacterium]|jgi:hypothetical protein
MGPMRAISRASVTRIGMLLLTLVALDGAYTWYVTDNAAATVVEIEARDGFVDVGPSDGGSIHQTEIENASRNDGDRIRQARLKWLPAVAVSLLGGLLSSRAEPGLQRSLVMLVAITLAVWAAPRIIYGDEIRVLESVYS